jgi:hypothetical protein
MRGKDVGLTRGFAASPMVGPGATVGTLRTGYPCVQASSQDNDSRLLAGGSSGAATCPCGSDFRLPARDSSEAATCPPGSGSRFPARGSSVAATWHLGSSTHHLAHGSSGAATCPEDGFCRPQANKQIPPGDQAIMISIGARTQRYATRVAPHAHQACSRRPIKCR